MQHNSIYGRVNKHFSKETDVPSNHQHSLKILPKTAELAELQLPTLSPTSTNNDQITSDISDATFHPIPKTTNYLELDIPTIDAPTFNVPVPMANNGTVTNIQPPVDDYE
jgi:hypothetical protein